jgi:Protein kinase domain
MEPLTADDPRQVSVFHLRARLGAGGMGRVYLGSSPGGRAVAVKVVHPELARDPEFMARFRREVEAASSVGAVYTAPVVSAGPDDSPPWLATVYVPGPSLAELVRGTGPLPEAAVWRLAGGLTEALQAIHGRGLVHRDLKPGNILIAVDGPRVIDFGISRALHGTALTGTRTTMGTPAYMSPEQAAGGEIGPASDVFALGSVLAFAATGTAPFEGGEPLSVIFRIVHGEPDLGRVPPAFGRLVAGCLAKDPVARPSLAALLDAVAAGAASFPPEAPGQYWPDPVAAAIAGQAAPGSFTPAAFPAARTPPVVSLGGTTAPPAHPATPARPDPGTSPAPGRRDGRGRWLLLGGAAVAAAVIGTVLALTLAPGSSSSGSGSLAGQTTSSSAAAAASHAATAPVAATSAATHAATPSSGPASSPAVPPSATASTAPPIAVTVCTFPADGCTVPGASQYMEVRPLQITDSGDGSGYVQKLVWSDWGGPQAHATGVQEVDNCNPNCAQGTPTGYPATVTLAGLKPYGTGLEAYSTIVIEAPAANLTYTYTKDTVP